MDLIGKIGKEKAVYLFAADEDEGKVSHGCYLGEVSAMPSET